MGTRGHESITPEQRLNAKRSLAELGVSEEVLESASLVVIGIRSGKDLRRLLEARVKESPTMEEADTLAQEVLSLYPDAVVARSLEDVARLFLRAQDYRDDAYDAVWGHGGCVLLKFWKDRR